MAHIWIPGQDLEQLIARCIKAWALEDPKAYRAFCEKMKQYKGMLDSGKASVIPLHVPNRLNDLIAHEVLTDDGRPNIDWLGDPAMQKAYKRVFIHATLERGGR